MTALILHHYDASPFSEKVRLMLGFKGLPWRSVKIPTVMPKPDLTALTGGYRRTPVLQVGADIHCDTALIARLLERQVPTPSLFPAAAPTAPLLAQWADGTLFWTVVAYTMQPAGLATMFAGAPPEAMKAFAADRAAFSAGVRRQTVADATAGLTTALASLEAQLARTAWLCGDAPSVADFSVAHCLWFVRRGGPVAGLLDAHGQVSRWLDRVMAFGHGQPVRMDSSEAVSIAAAASAAGHHVATAVAPGSGFEAGAAVTVMPIDYGCDPVAGTLVGLDSDEVVLRRTDLRAGAVQVHFPRVGYQIKPAQA